MHDAFKTALEQWRETGIPSNPRAWLVSTGRFKAIDRIRRQSKFDPLPAEQADKMEGNSVDPSAQVEKVIEDDVLRLIFTCCHPALSFEARVALTLREVCDLTTEEIARAYLVRPSALAQRIVRARARIREAKIPFEVPPAQELPNRLEAVLQSIYLIYNEGYYASSGESLTRVDLSGEAIRLGRLLHDLLPDSEVAGLLALLHLHEARRPARTTPEGDLVLLGEQDRSLWDRDMIKEGFLLLNQAFSSARIGPYTLQAAIAAVHVEAASPDATDWSQIAGLYGLLLRINPSPVVELNRAIAVAECEGPEQALRQIDAILERGDLLEYQLAHSARAEMCRRLARMEEARRSWESALDLAEQEPERRFIRRKLEELRQ
jgi:RNA polymerase sigma-70 factor (ECF subfamily)